VDISNISIPRINIISSKVMEVSPT